jgi:hypothetical protein
MIKIYKDVAANAIFIEDPNGAQFMNTLHATVDVVDTVSVTDQAKGFEILTAIPHTDIADENGNPYPGTAVQVCDALNALFALSGTSSGEVPSITSSTAIALVQGETLNYELTADYGVGYEWDLSNVSGVTTVEGNVRKLVGGRSLGAGTYNIPVKAINYNGEDSRTVVLTVSNPPFADTKSIQFNNNDYLGANAALLDATLGRASNGSGASDAWSISFWFKAGTSSKQDQTIFYYGSDDVDNGNHLVCTYNGDKTAKQQLTFRYGSDNNYLLFESPVGAVASADGWQHIILTYDGGSTGSSSGSINQYYGRFKMYINGVQQSTLNSHSNYGNTTGMSGQNLRVGRYDSSGYMRNSCKLDELAIWDSDQSGNASALYNAGSTFDLTTLGTPPTHWWRMGDGDAYPALLDQVGTAHFVMYNMTVADIVSDVP